MQVYMYTVRQLFSSFSKRIWPTTSESIMFGHTILYMYIYIIQYMRFHIHVYSEIYA